MASLHPQTLKSNARLRLDNARPDPRQMVLIHIGVTLLLNLLASGLNLYLDHQIGDTGGLSGLGTRSILQSIQSFLQYGILLFSPFWQAGFVLVTLRWADGKTSKPTDLLSGFSRVGSLFAYQLFLFLIYIVVGIVCGYAAVMVFLFTPLSNPLVEILMPAATSGSTVDMTALMSMDNAALMDAYLPMLIIYLVILIPVVVFITYNLRLTTYFIMDDGHPGVFGSMKASLGAMRGNRLKMLKLDLSFWWFYLLEAILVVVCNLDSLLSNLGIALPFDPTTAYFITLIVYCVLELLLSLWMKAQVDTTYALAYREITAPPKN